MKNVHVGMKFKCSAMFCNKCYHPICAYLNGCVFVMKRRKNLFKNKKGKSAKGKIGGVDKEK